MESKYTPEQIAEVRREIEARKAELVRQRIRGMRASYHRISIRDIAFYTGIPIQIIEETLGEKRAPLWVG